MSIPNHEDIRLPALELLSKYASIKLREFEPRLAEMFRLSDEERYKEYDAGDKKVFLDRIYWSLKDLCTVGLVEIQKRDIYGITDLGRKVLKNPEKLAESIKDYNVNKTIKTNKTQEASKESGITHSTPRDEFDASVRKIKDTIHDDILSEILRKSPRAFEELVVKLLKKMGYGGAIASSGEVTSYSNDKGIDGIIKEDVLGLGYIHIQAKRYARDRSVGREDIQKFVGALAPVRSNKGVFITTSKYTQGALEYASSLNGMTTLVLIDGKQLAEYIYNYNLGMQVEQTIEIKKLDSDFWSAMQDA